MQSFVFSLASTYTDND